MPSHTTGKRPVTPEEIANIRAGAAARPLAAATFLGIGETTLFRLIRDGELRVAKIGRRTLIPADDLKAYLENGTHRHG